MVDRRRGKVNRLTYQAAAEKITRILIDTSWKDPGEMAICDVAYLILRELGFEDKDE